MIEVHNTSQQQKVTIPKHSISKQSTAVIRNLFSTALIPMGTASYFIFKADTLGLSPAELALSTTTEEIILLISMPIVAWKDQWDNFFNL